MVLYFIDVDAKHRQVAFRLLGMLEYPFALNLHEIYTRHDSSSYAVKLE